jgi:hypothetical protein
MSDVTSIQHVTHFWLPKAGHTLEEYEDAGGADQSQGRFAIADGASESAFARQWAESLVEGFAGAPRPLNLREWLLPCQQRWHQAITAGPLPWYAEAKVQEGAFATFLGLVIETTGVLFWKRTRWLAVAVGDSCLVQVRAGQLLQSFPLHSAAEFSNSPWLVRSHPEALARLQGQELLAEGDCQPGDRLWLMTDALAQWFLEQAERGGQPWEPIDALGMEADGQRRFAEWIEGLRERREIRNDDVTLLAVWL